MPDHREMQLVIRGTTARLTESLRAMQAAGDAMAQSMIRATQALSALGLAFIRPVLVIDDPAERWPTGWRAFGRQIIDIVVHEYWVAAGHPERSPGARWDEPPHVRAIRMADKFQAQVDQVQRAAGMPAGKALERLQRAIDAMGRAR